MTKIGFVYTCLALIFACPSCTSYFVRKDCEKTDWFEYGKGVAMSGNRLSGNTYVRRCEEVESNINYTALDQGFKKGMMDYCRPETVLAIGRRGEFFSPDMCDGENIRLLKAEHKKGVISYCQKANGQAAGALGKKYNQICPKELEAEFLVEFNKGRKRFLAAAVQQSEGEIADIERDISSLESQKNSFVTQLASIGSDRIVSREMKYDEFTHSYHEETSVREDDAVKQRRDDLRRQMESTDREIASKRDQQMKLRKNIRDLNAELVTL